MGISPITNLAPLPISRAIEKELEPLPMERVESSSRTGDETYSPSNGRSARGAEDDGAGEDGAEEEMVAEDGAEESFADEAVPEEEFQNLAGENGAQAFLDSTDEHPAPRISFLA